MNHLKILGLLAMAAASLMAFASSAWAAPTLTSPTGMEYTGTIHLTLEPGTSLLVKAGIESTCTESTMHGVVAVNNMTHAEVPLTATGTPPTGLSFGHCTKHTTVINPGTLTISDTGTAFLINTRVQIRDTGLEVSCFYGAEGIPVDIGKLTGGTPATLDINTTELKRLPGSSFFCAANGTMTGGYLVTTPNTLLIT